MTMPEQGTLNAALHKDDALAATYAPFCKIKYKGLGIYEEKSLMRENNEVIIIKSASPKTSIETKQP